MEELSLDDIGMAEQVLNKLISERRALDTGANVLAAYRQAAAALQNTWKELEVIHANLKMCREELAIAEGERESRLRDIDAEYEKYRAEQNTQVQGEIDALLAQRTLLMVEKSNLERDLQALKDEYEVTSAAQLAEHEKRAREIADMAEKYRALSQTITNAASILVPST